MGTCRIVLLFCSLRSLLSSRLRIVQYTGNERRQSILFCRFEVLVSSLLEVCRITGSLVRLLCTGRAICFGEACLGISF